MLSEYFRRCAVHHAAGSWAGYTLTYRKFASALSVNPQGCKEGKVRQRPKGIATSFCRNIPELEKAKCTISVLCACSCNGPCSETADLP